MTTYPSHQWHRQRMVAGQVISRFDLQRIRNNPVIQIVGDRYHMEWRWSGENTLLRHRHTIVEPYLTS